MKQIATLILAASFTLLVNEIRAQVPAAVQQSETVQQRRQLEQAAQATESGESAPELFPGETSDVGPQSILKIKPRRTWFEAMADVQYFYTDNMFLNEHDKVDADVLVSTAQFALAPTPYALGNGQFSPRLGFRQEFYSFGLASGKEVDVVDVPPGFPLRQEHLDEFDFNAQTFFADGQWRCGDWIVGGGFDFKRLMDTGDYDQFYRESVVRWGLQRLIPICEKSTLAIGYAGDYRFTDTDLPPPSLDNDFNDRTDHSLLVNYSVALCQHAVVQPYYRFQYTHFTADEGRNDYLNSFGVALYCYFTPRISVRAFVSYDMLETSSSRIPDYNNLNAGGGVNLVFRF